MRPIQVAILFAVVCMSAGVVQAGAIGNVWYTGSVQGVIAGSSEIYGRQDSSDLLAFSQTAVGEPDADDGCQATGPRDHYPVTITKIIDSASPLLLRAWNTHEKLTVTLRFYKIDPATHSEVNFYTIVLRDAYILGIRQEMPLTLLAQNQTYQHMERVSFTYGRYSETSEETGMTASDEWRNSCPQYIYSDLNFDGIVNMKDFAIIANEWLVSSF